MISRKALLVGCPGGIRNKYLHGISSDYKNTIAYLTSPRGGSFHQEDEIVRVHNPTSKELIKVIQDTKVDYANVFFFGHGHTDTYSNERIISLRDHDVPDTYLLTKSRVQTIVVDSCRDFVPGIAGISQYVDPYSSFDGVSEARVLFDEFIGNANSGFQIVHGTQSGESAWEQVGGGGGLFTTSLLQVASTMPTNYVNMPYYLEQLLPKVVNEINKRGHRDQIPCLVEQTPGFNMPFMISARQILAKAPVTIKPLQSRSNRKASPIAELACVAVLAICIGSLFSK
jgi:Caspase domain